MTNTKSGEPAVDLVIVHISDLHFGRMLKVTKNARYRRWLGISEHSYNLPVALSTAVDRLHDRYGDSLAVIVTGDITTSAHPAAFSVAANYLGNKILVAPEIFTGFGSPNVVSVVPGNHDKFLRSLLTSRDRSDAFAEYFPTNFPAFRIVGAGAGYVLVFSLDSNRVEGFNPLNIRNLMTRGQIGERQLGDLVAMAGQIRMGALSDRLPNDFDYDNSLKIAVMHHHAALPVERPQNRMIHDVVDARQLLDVLGEIDVKLVLCGHEHHPYHRNLRVGSGKTMVLSCAGSAIKMDEPVNSFKVYYVRLPSEVYMEQFVASSGKYVYAFAPSGAAVPLLPTLNGES